MHIFVDSSVDHKKNKSVGCWVAVYDLERDLDDIAENIQHIFLQSNSSTSAELETIKHILSNVTSNGKHQINLYTDCSRLVKLYENKSFKKNNKNADIYKELLDLFDELNVKVIKLKGHLKKELQIDKKQQIFSLVDKRSRKMMREKNEN